MSNHIAAAPDDIAETVLLPGDPLRARWIATTYLDDASCYSSVRNMLGYTGTYRGQRISVQGTGMGQPSLSIYAHELLAEYGARTLVRVGSCGGLQESVAIRDVIVAMSASTDSSINFLRFHGLNFAPAADFTLVRAYVERAENAGVPHHIGQIFSTDSFYLDRPELHDRLRDYGVLAVEMETAALYTLAAKFDARALSVNTVSDSLVTGEALSSDDRERSFAEMVELTLDTVTASGSAGGGESRS
ncbi:purine-nucleoside phosphorylase [Actinobacteria bacterium YIM 96077]|uniref:Uridine phosphorylase n=1 Tax=Phytoactinopolyspora halophila TaxID=1981511 RepID=A0A329R348_9ACTN|nr:purine-nucleoside phosphorylase [Phytoactinopolyspora halophila]AYY11953.1 purine-nucleoside phosphorylase [Actinobacteria bacterium YIM 96077]RAW18813.1 purine-nucleoside phosphorylase [Phytoactinopolyspora halophila]